MFQMVTHARHLFFIKCYFAPNRTKNGPNNIMNFYKWTTKITHQRQRLSLLPLDWSLFSSVFFFVPLEFLGVSRGMYGNEINSGRERMAVVILTYGSIKTLHAPPANPNSAVGLHSVPYKRCIHLPGLVHAPDNRMSPCGWNVRSSRGLDCVLLLLFFFWVIEAGFQVVALHVATWVWNW